MVVLEKTLEGPLDCKEIQPVHPKGNQSWIFSGMTDAETEAPVNTLATWCEELTHLKRPWCWERLKAGGKGDDRRWDGWMASLTQWTCVWVGSGSWWWSGKPGVLQSKGSQRVRHNWVAELILIKRRNLDMKTEMQRWNMVWRHTGRRWTCDWNKAFRSQRTPKIYGTYQKQKK